VIGLVLTRRSPAKIVRVDQKAADFRHIDRSSWTAIVAVKRVLSLKNLERGGIQPILLAIS